MAYRHGGCQRCLDGTPGEIVGLLRGDGRTGRFRLCGYCLARVEFGAGVTIYARLA